MLYFQKYLLFLQYIYKWDDTLKINLTISADNKASVSISGWHDFLSNLVFIISFQSKKLYSD